MDTVSFHFIDDVMGYLSEEDIRRLQKLRSPWHNLIESFCSKLIKLRVKIIARDQNSFEAEAVRLYRNPRTKIFSWIPWTKDKWAKEIRYARVEKLHLFGERCLTDDENCNLLEVLNLISIPPNFRESFDCVLFSELTIANSRKPTVTEEMTEICRHLHPGYRSVDIQRIDASSESQLLQKLVDFNKVVKLILPEDSRNKFWDSDAKRILHITTLKYLVLLGTKCITEEAMDLFKTIAASKRPDRKREIFVMTTFGNDKVLLDFREFHRKQMKDHVDKDCIFCKSLDALYAEYHFWLTKKWWTHIYV
ncbi:hypothetical protein QR680_010318 [Steinernema hermaphroditum]|uniref:F-box domain-containing protein n=1 Tax=Steinernema hermaphroditum TaxID=289476 RepID=A0AA39IR75_9BILA|nr:hypothetical protein QR680_010318 [Steinernema hermaphroditum]